eukprot:2872144-Prorocentrum_lima.AAC.1
MGPPPSGRSCWDASIQRDLTERCSATLHLPGRCQAPAVLTCQALAGHDHPAGPAPHCQPAPRPA